MAGLRRQLEIQEGSGQKEFLKYLYVKVGSIQEGHGYIYYRC